MKNRLDFTEGPILKKFLLYVVPLLFTSLLQMLYSMADTMISGTFIGDEALAAVGLTAAPTNMMLTFFVSLSVGTDVVCANYIGGRDKEGVSRTVHTSAMLGMAIGIPMMVAGWLLSTPFLRIIDTPEGILSLSSSYMRIIFTGVPFILIYDFCSAVLRASGDAKRPMYIAVVCGFINVVLNVVFIVVFEWGVEGVALATVISQVLSAGAVVIILHRDNTECGLRFSKLRIHSKELKKILLIGIPSGVSNMAASLSHVTLQGATNTFGTIAVAANNVAGQIEGFCTMPLYACSAGIASFVGQNYGAGKMDRISRVFRVGLLCSMFSTLFLSTLTYLCGDFVIGLFSDNPDVAAETMKRLTVILLPYFLYAISSSAENTMRGMGNTVRTAIVSLTCVCLLRILWINTVWRTFPSLNMIYILYPITWIIAGVAMNIMRISMMRKERKKLT